MKTTTDNPKKTREYYAIARAIKDLQNLQDGKTGGNDHAMRDVIFDLAHSYHYGRVEAAAADLIAENPEADSDRVADLINEEADRLCIYTADNLVATLASERDDAWTEYESAGKDGSEPSLERRAFFATVADLEAAVARRSVA